MKTKFFVLLLVVTSLAYPWGDKGHKLIANKAVQLLKGKIKCSELVKVIKDGNCQI